MFRSLQRTIPNLYQSLIARLNTVQGSLHSIVRQAQNDKQVKELLQSYQISLDEVIQNMTKYFQSIKKCFNSKLPKSIKAFQATVNILQKKMVGYSRDQSSVKRSSLLLSFEDNLKNILQIVNSICEYQDDITAFKLFENPKFNPVYQKIKSIKDMDPEKSQDQNKFLTRMMVITNAAVITELQNQNCFLRLLSFGISFPRFALGFQTAQLKGNIFLRNPKISILSQIWNLPEKGAIGTLKYVQFECIKTNRMLYIPKKDQPLCLQQESEGSIPVRLIYNDDVQFKSDTKWCCNPKLAKQINQIIFHFHGGGFISLSSSTTQSYTRRWAKSLNIPVLSVDYSMPPENRFPSAVQDAFAVYKFVISKLSSFCNINPKKIILAGDSAGGNIACSLMGLILKERLPIPAGIFLAYPACNLKIQYSPSRLYSFFTPILHPSLLYLCLTQYLGPQHLKIQNHPLASPLYLTNQFVGNRKGDYRFPSNWPRTRIIIGDKDPLFDDSIRLCQRMVQSGIDVRCTVYQNLSHGFLSLEKVVSRGEQAIIQSISLLKDCLA